MARIRERFVTTIDPKSQKMLNLIHKNTKIPKSVITDEAIGLVFKKYHEMFKFDISELEEMTKENDK